MDSRFNTRQRLGRALWGSLVLACGIFISGCSRSPEPSPSSAGERVVSLAPSLTEIICAIGAERQLVGRTSACDYPPDKVAAIPVIGGFGAPSLDLLLNIQPTLVLDTDLQDESMGKMIDQLGLKRRRIACSTVDDIPRAMLQVGRLLCAEESAHKLADPLRRRLAALRQEAERRQTARHPAPSVFVEIWGDPLTTVGKQSFISDLIFLAGGYNIGDAVTQKDYFTVSAEWVIARNPDIIICLYMAKNKVRSGQVQNPPRHPASGGISGPLPLEAATGPSAASWSRVANRTGWTQTKAVKTRRIYGNLDNSVILRPGPRVLEGIEALRQCMEPKDRPGDRGKERQGDGETKRQEDTETKRQDEQEE